MGHLAVGAPADRAAPLVLEAPGDDGVRDAKGYRFEGIHGVGWKGRTAGHGGDSNHGIQWDPVTLA
jgi:hypothetical protein